MVGEHDPFASWPDRTPLNDEDGYPLLVFTPTETRDGRRWADGVWRPALVPVQTGTDAALHAFAGWTFSTSDEELVATLVDAGATVLRHAHSMSHPLETLNPVDSDRRLKIEPITPAQLQRHAERLGEMAFAAYAPGHPDHEHATAHAAVDEIRAISRGELLGPLMSESRVALFAAQIVGACLVVDRGGHPPDAGPWIIDIFRDIDTSAKGVGKALLAAVLVTAQRNGLEGVSLAVSHDNTRARHLYEAMGFHETLQSWTLALPS